MHKKIALFGGIYNNYLALEAAIEDAHKNNVDEIFCLGDLGAFGPYPDRTISIIRQNKIQVVQGNYDNSIGNDLNDCQCGYTDPRDNYHAKLSYDYTFQNTSDDNKQWLKQLPGEIKLKLGKMKVLLCHGSPRMMNEFLWESSSPTHFLEKLCNDHSADIVCTTHTGLHWVRKLSDNKYFINVGVLGRPENNGLTEVGYTLLEIDNEDEVRTSYIPIHYDNERLAFEMIAENIPEKFVETILTGWWTTCLEILPSKERIKGKF